MTSSSSATDWSHFAALVEKSRHTISLEQRSVSARVWRRRPLDRHLFLHLQHARAEAAEAPVDEGSGLDSSTRWRET